MPVVISGTNGVSGVDGTASNPSYEGTDSNTGIFFPAADTIAFAEGGTEVARFDSSGNFGIGTSSPGTQLELRKATDPAVRVFETGSSVDTRITSLTTAGIVGTYSNSPLVFYTNTTERMRIDSSGNVGIGTASPAARLHVNAAAGTSSIISITASAGNGGIIQLAGNANTLGTTSFDILQGGDGTAFVYSRASGAPLVFGTANTERARIDSSGNLLVGTTSASSRKLFVKGVGVSGEYFASFENDNATNPLGIDLRYPALDPNNAVSQFLDCRGVGTVRLQIRSNGGIANFSGNNVNLSDRREKTNFAPAKSYLDTICAIPVQTFNYIDQNHEEDPGLTLGVVAQDVQAVAPELVMESNWGTKEEPKMRLSVYQTDLQYALMKCIQEQQQMIETLQAKVAALEAK